VSVFDHAPGRASLRGLPQRLTLPAEGFAIFRYQFRIFERGDHEFGEIEVAVESPLKLWTRFLRSGEPDSIRVYPDFHAALQYTLFSDRIKQLGIRKQRRRGEGLDFHQLRPYRDGDSPRHIDWKSTSKHGKLISREYQDERDQQIVFMLDCGRRMRGQDGALGHFDHALNSMLLLSNAALRQGDSVGLMSFAGERRWLAPRKGISHVTSVLNATYDLKPSTHAPDYLAASQELLNRQRMRSLVVLISNLRDEDNDELLPAIRLLRRRHLVLVASLRDAALDRALEAPVVDRETALAVGATHHYLVARENAHDRLRGERVVWLDSPPAELPKRLVNQYLDIKSAGRL